VEGCKSIKQKLRRTHSEVLIKVKAKIEKQWNAGFLEVVKYPQWVSNIVVVPKKEGKIRVCVDFRDDTTKRLMSSPKCRSVEVINNPVRPGSNHREVNYINYK